MNAKNANKAIDDPSLAFSSPRQVVESELPREEKIKILKSWELDARRLLESAEENMAGGEKDRLPEVFLYRKNRKPIHKF